MSFKCPSCGRFTKHEKAACGKMACTYYCTSCETIYPVIQSLKALPLSGGE